MGGMIDAMWGMGLRGADAREALRSLPEEQVRAIIDRASAVSDVTVSRKGANPPWAHELSEERHSRNEAGPHIGVRPHSTHE